MEVNRSSQRVLVLEPHLSGHHGAYLSWIIPGLIEGGRDITLVTDEAAAMDAAASPIIELSEAVGPALRVVYDRHEPWLDRSPSSHLGLARKQLRYWHLFRRWYDEQAREAPVDAVLLPYLDYCLYVIGVLGSPFRTSAWTGITMRPSFHYRAMGVQAPASRQDLLEEILFKRVLKDRHLSRLLTIDEPLFDYVTERYSPAAPIAYLPEPVWTIPVVDPLLAKRELGLDPSCRHILVYGALGLRKGLLELLQATLRPDFPADTTVVLAGVPDRDTRDLLAAPIAAQLRAKRRLLVWDRFMDDDEEALLYGAADVVWLGYRGHYGSSGVLAQAAQARRAVIACSQGVIGWQTRRHRLGTTVDISNPTQVVTALQLLLDGTVRPPEACPASGGNWCTKAHAQTILADALTHMSSAHNQQGS